MADISLRKIDSTNWRDAIRLTVADDQLGFVATNAKSLAQSAYDDSGTWYPRGIYDGDTMVGFVMWGKVTFDDNTVWAIMRLMVDKNQQRKGYGRAAMVAVMEHIKANRDGMDDLYISFVPENEAARVLYTDLGFTDAGFTPDGSEVLMRYTLT